MALWVDRIIRQTTLTDTRGIGLYKRTYGDGGKVRYIVDVGGALEGKYETLTEAIAHYDRVTARVGTK